MDYRASSFVKPSNPEAIYDIFKSLFNEDEIESLKQADGIVALNMAVEESGKILEVNFAFSNIPILTNIHPNTFHILCTKVKSNVEMNFPDFLKEWCSYAKSVPVYIYLNKL